MRCKHLAIIFDGCKDNVGLKVSVIVKLIGPAAIVVMMGQIIPLSGQEMWLVDEGKAKKALVTESPRGDSKRLAIRSNQPQFPNHPRSHIHQRSILPNPPNQLNPRRQPPLPRRQGDRRLPRQIERHREPR